MAKYILGMGSDEWLDDGTFDAIEDAHEEAKELRFDEDNDEHYDCYQIGELKPATKFAAQCASEVTNKIVGIIGEILINYDAFNSPDYAHEICINQDGVERLGAVIKDVLENHTKYQYDEVLTSCNEYRFKD